VIYILIILWFPNTSQSGKAIHSAEFSTSAACEHARTEVLRQEKAGPRNFELLRAVCVPKSK